MSSLLLALLATSGCGDDDSRPPTVEAPASDDDVALSSLFPLHPGDRWRLESSDGALRIEGVTGVDASGIAAIHGTGHTWAERYRADAGEISLVTPEGRTLSPVLRAPVREGESVSYSHQERDVAVPCEVLVVSTAERAEVAGVRASDCVSLRRRCRYPAGAPFPTETTHTSEETYCPRIGLVRSRSVFRPPPTRSAIPADREERVIGFIVRGGPTPRTNGCDRYILMPNDIVAACGPDTVVDEPARSATGEDGPSGECRYGFRHGSETFEVTIGAPRDQIPEDALVHVEADERAAWLTGAAAACRGAERLAPLLASLLG